MLFSNDDELQRSVLQVQTVAGPSSIHASTACIQHPRRTTSGKYKTKIEMRNIQSLITRPIEEVSSKYYYIICLRRCFCNTSYCMINLKNPMIQKIGITELWFFVERNKSLHNLTNQNRIMFWHQHCLNFGIHQHNRVPHCPFKC